MTVRQTERPCRYQSYQQASERVRAIIAAHVGTCPIERASIDEFYVDLTSILTETIGREEAQDDDDFDHRPVSRPSHSTTASDVHVEGGINVAYQSPVERRMMRASALARAIRAEILAKEGMTVSGACSLYVSYTYVTDIERQRASHTPRCSQSLHPRCTSPTSKRSCTWLPLRVRAVTYHLGGTLPRILVLRLLPLSVFARPVRYFA